MKEKYLEDLNLKEKKILNSIKLEDVTLLDYSQERFYVYAYRKLDGDIFYIGHGSSDRKDQTKKSRNSRLAEILSEGNYTIDIVSDGLTKKQAIKLENESISKLGRDLLNIQKKTKDLTIRYEDIKDVFIIDNSSPSGLVWKKGLIGKYKGLVVRNYFNKKDAWTSYHFDKLGEQEAYRRAINFRQQIEEKIKQELDKLLQLCRMRQEIFKSNSKKD